MPRFLKGADLWAFGQTLAAHVIRWKLALWSSRRFTGICGAPDVVEETAAIRGTLAGSLSQTERSREAASRSFLTTCDNAETSLYSTSPFWHEMHFMPALPANNLGAVPVLTDQVFVAHRSFLCLWAYGGQWTSD